MAEAIRGLEGASNHELANLSHKRRKVLLKKQKRKIKRQAEAREREEKLKKEEELKKNSPNYNQKLAYEEELEKAELLQIEEESKRQRELWEWHEEMYKQRLKEREEQAEREKQLKIEIEKKIKEEWEERQKKEKEEEEEKRKKKEKQEELLKQAREAENKDGDWSNPLAPVQYGKERQVETCPFFTKVAACRFGDRCSRSHPYPDSSRTLLFCNMFRHFQLDQGLCEEYDTDIVLEYEDSEVYQKFREFYEDTLPEFKVIGHLVQFKVCCNFQPHLRGNVYVSYSREDHAIEAFTKFNARWYGGKQISAQFVEIPSWRRAICGLFGKGRCPKGRECNFLHVFKNPSNEFDLADRDMEPFTPQQGHRHRDRRSRDRRYSPSKSSRSHRHSRSRDRHDSYRSNIRYPRRRSRSSERCKSYSSKHRSRSPDERSFSKRHRSRSPEYRSSHSRQRSRSPFRNRRSHRSKDGKIKNRSRSHSKENSLENSPCRDQISTENSVPNLFNNTVSIDNIESYENSVNNCDKLIWVEKTKESLDGCKTSKDINRSYFPDGSDTEVERSTSDTDSDSHRKKHKKSKKHKRLKK